MAVMLALAVLLLASAPMATASAIRGGDADNICSANATLGRQILAAMNLSWPGLQPVADAAAAGSLGLACELLADYYKNATSGSWLRLPSIPPSPKKAGGEADRALEDIFTLSGVDETAKIPRNPDGGLDWYDEGPRKDPEFMNCLNRHQYFDTLVGAWQGTGNTVYAAKVGDLVTDWVVHLPCNPCTTGTMESPWRILEVGIRTAEPWPRAFYGLQTVAEFNTTARVLMLLGFHEHGIALMKYGSEGFANWRMQQWAGLATIALALPELADSAVWATHALAGLQTELDAEVYADGVETEQTSGYDLMSANNFFTVLQTLQYSGTAPPKDYRAGVENMFQYLNYAIDQYGYLPRNGDTDYFVPNYAYYIKYFNRSDWEYVFTAGKSGTVPSGNPSVMFPWAGQFIMRSGWTRSDQWAFFDLGPYGSSGHAHRDKLHLNIRAYGSLLLADSGRFAYQGEGAVYHANYAPTTRAHNTISIDECDQSATPAVANAPVDPKTYTIGTTYDYGRGTMAQWDKLVGNASHTRAVLYRKGEWWVVVDAVHTDRPRTIETYWHTHPNATITVNADTSATIKGVPAGQIAVIPAAGSPWAVRIAKGEQPPQYPHYQGWFSQGYLDCEKSATLVYKASIGGPAVFVWLLLPAPVPGPVSASVRVVQSTASAVSVIVSVAGQADVSATIAIA